MRNLIVGKNSLIVRQISENLLNFDFVSHSELSMITTFDNYVNIFVFSWSKEGLSENIEILKKLPNEKVVFISTVAVFSLCVRNQIARYPSDKKFIENYVLDNGGSVIRLGIWNFDHLKKSFGSVPVTTNIELVNLLNNYSKYSQKILMPVSIFPGELNGLKKFFSALVYKTSLYLPSTYFFQAPLQLLVRSLGVKTYGYTADACAIFFNELMVGFGVLGSSYYLKYPKSINVIVSGKSDNVLNGDGFANTRIGLSKIGLSKFWHGVSIVKSNSKYKKRVPIFIKRMSPPRGYNKLHVDKILDHKIYFELIYQDELNTSKSLFVNKLTMAAGPLENIRLLGSMVDIEAKLSDHEVAAVGSADTTIAISQNFIKKIGFLIFPDKCVLHDFGKFQFLIELRPYVPEKHNSNSAFYMDSTLGIVKKIFKQFSFLRLNEAIFNKFGIGFYTKKMSIFCQILSEDCIRFTPPDIFTRTRLDKKELTELKNILSESYPNFNFDNDFITVDAQHIVGGKDFYKNKYFTELITGSRLKVLGSPTLYSLTARHHTRDFLDLI